MARQLGITKRISLEGLADGWGNECYILSTPVTYGELKAFKQLDTDNMSEDEGIDKMIEFVTNHVAGGKIKILNDAGELELADAEKDDVKQMSSQMVDHLFEQMTGIGSEYRDPKASQTEVTSSATPSSDDAPTETS